MQQIRVMGDNFLVEMVAKNNRKYFDATGKMKRVIHRLPIYVRGL